MRNTFSIIKKGGNAVMRNTFSIIKEVAQL